MIDTTFFQSKPATGYIKQVPNKVQNRKHQTGAVEERVNRNALRHDYQAWLYAQGRPVAVDLQELEGAALAEAKLERAK